MSHTTITPFSPPQLAHKNVILIEDDQDTREFMLTVLERTGATVHVATDGLTALDEIQRIAAQNRPVLIILDFVLPSISGGDIVKRLQDRAELRDIPLLVITGYPQDKELETLKGLTILTKPAKVSDIYQKITEALAQ